MQALTSIVGSFYSTDRAYLKQQVRIWCGVFVAIGAGSLLAGALQGYCFTVMGAKLTRRIRVVLILALMRQVRLDPAQPPLVLLATHVAV